MCEVRSVLGGKKRMGRTERRERVSLYFSTLCLFSCVRIGCQRWYRYTLVVCSIKSGCEGFLDIYGLPY